MSTNFETLAHTVVTAALGLPLPASVETGFTGATPKNIAVPLTASLAKAFRCSRDAQREERDGFPFTAAMKWRKAAELFAPDARAVEYCWCEWERVMGLSRRLAGAGSFSTSDDVSLIH